MNRFLSRAAQATRSSKRVAIRERFESVELVRDIAAMANSGGGVIVLAGAAGVDEELIHEELARYAEPEFEAFTVERISRNGRPATAIVVEGAKGTPLVFSKQGRAGGGVAFARGGAEVAVVETAERDEEGRPTLIRLTTDPHAPLYGQVDPDHSHPYRQKEVIREVNARLRDREVNAFDVLSVRRVHAITEETRPEFVHVPKFGSPQYSDAFVDWLVAEDNRDPQFFARAKAAYLATRPRRRSAASGP